VWSLHKFGKSCLLKESNSQILPHQKFTKIIAMWRIWKASSIGYSIKAQKKKKKLLESFIHLTNVLACEYFDDEWPILLQQCRLHDDVTRSAAVIIIL
jgi:hypothetical protein